MRMCAREAVPKRRFKVQRSGFKVKYTAADKRIFKRYRARRERISGRSEKDVSGLKLQAIATFIIVGFSCVLVHARGSILNCGSLYAMIVFLSF
jgi:hypothetical protein